eukprot:CAMPEP_0168513384 /NCGR_PEP_ID=MMETSP0405-20121227/3421_1 /TAXON_ID=498012 /ORGANISM="Trichosphaerium sp, Strain Am-I-7 wt" /LENGTH=284 /DNA_ID=CAMNT_0008532187 /DNA_START=130 /DNA_END=984 /DNA_ORIENTATION=+
MTHLSKAKFLLCEGNRLEAYKLAKKGVEYLSEVNKNAVSMLLAVKLLIETFAQLDSAEEFLFCLNHIKASAKKWPLARMVFRLFLSMKYQRPKHDMILARIPNINKEGDEFCPHFMFWEGTKISDLLRKLDREGNCTVTESYQPGVIDSPEAIKKLIALQDAIFIPFGCFCVHAKPVIANVPSMSNQIVLPQSPPLSLIPQNETEFFPPFLMPSPGGYPVSPMSYTSQDGRESNTPYTPQEGAESNMPYTSQDGFNVDSVGPSLDDPNLIWSPLEDTVMDKPLW